MSIEHCQQKQQQQQEEDAGSTSNMDLISLVMQNTSYDQHITLYIDPDHPTRSITAAEARGLVKQLIAGLKAYGLKKGDCVCVHAYNDVLAGR